MARNMDALADLVPDILSRLPVKSLLRFKSVTKSWYNIINDPHFISKHYLSFNDNKLRNGVSLLVKTKNDTILHAIPKTLSLFSHVYTTNSSSTKLINLNTLTISSISGPCNGIYFLNCSDFYALLNPSTREFKVLPESSSHSSKLIEESAGFIFDARENDYKVVLIRRKLSYDDGIYEKESLPSMICSVNSYESWRILMSPVPSFGLYSGYFCSSVQGQYHWGITDFFFNDLILTFDVVDEVFRTIRLPTNDNYDRVNVRSVIPFKESTSVLVWYSVELESRMDIWVIEEMGNDKSWTKKFTIAPMVGILHVLLVWKNDHILVVDEDLKLVLHDLYTVKSKDLNMRFVDTHKYCITVWNIITLVVL